MKISEFAVKNYQFTLIILVMAIVVGVITLINMPRLRSELNTPYFHVIVVILGRHQMI
jgi:multidrug efflux pump subunit AcrB